MNNKQISLQITSDDRNSRPSGSDMPKQRTISFFSKVLVLYGMHNSPFCEDIVLATIEELDEAPLLLSIKDR